MSDIAIRVENLSKQYKIGPTLRHDRLKDLLTHSLNGLFRRPRSPAFRLLSSDPPNPQFAIRNSQSDYIWAIKDVSFEVKEGEVLGIIGSNGAGKSTLLKILSRITEPTSGLAEIYGRVGSLLEVGTGFDRELTGRENIYLNGAILGMTKNEIDTKFDEIVDFSGVEKFIDTPVKRYSSGMYVRLAFAVAAHLEPEILIVDEVLAVGDAAFQKKCLGKMGAVAKEGRTVLFVSHNMGAIENLCGSAIWINDGTIVLDGSVPDTVDAYLNSTTSYNVAPHAWKRSGTGEARIRNVCLLDSNSSERDVFRMGESLVVQLTVSFFESFKDIDLSLEVKRVDSRMSILHMLNKDSGFNIDAGREGDRTFQIEIPNCLLYPARYSLSVYVGKRGLTLDRVEDILSFSIYQSSVSKRTTPFHLHLGVMHQLSYWREI